MKLETFLASAFVTTVVGLGTWSWYYGKSPLASYVAPPPTSSVAPAPVLSVYNASPKIEPSASEDEEARGLKRKDVMLERCHAGGGIAVVGYDWRVVCVKPSAADWWDDPQFQEKP